MSEIKRDEKGRFVKGFYNGYGFKKGNIPWSKNLTKETDERVRRMVEKGGLSRRGKEPWNKDIHMWKDRKHPNLGKHLWKDKPHPRGMLGKKQSEFYIKQVTERMKINNPDKRPEVREKIRLAKLGKHISPKTEFKIGHLTSLNIRQKMREKRIKRKFPRKDTKIEKIMQEGLNKKNINYIPYHPILKICQTDMFIPPNICIFCDGNWWHANPKYYDRNKLHPMQERVLKRDENQTKKLLENNFIILRFWEDEILNNFDNCIKKIMEVISNGESTFNQSTIY